MREDLEQTIENEPHLRKFTADTLAYIVFSTAITVPVELFVSGMSLSQTIQTRLTSVPINAVAGRPIGVYRDWWYYKVCKVNDKTSNSLYKYFADTTAFLTSNSILYVGILYSAGADPKQIIKGVTTITIMAPLVGRPYAWMLKKFRNLFGVNKEPKPIYAADLPLKNML